MTTAKKTPIGKGICSFKGRVTRASIEVNVDKRLQCPISIMHMRSTIFDTIGACTLQNQFFLGRVTRGYVKKKNKKKSILLTVFKMYCSVSNNPFGCVNFPQVIQCACTQLNPLQ